MPVESRKRKTPWAESPTSFSHSSRVAQNTVGSQGEVNPLCFGAPHEDLGLFELPGWVELPCVANFDDSCARQVELPVLEAGTAVVQVQSVFHSISLLLVNHECLVHLDNRPLFLSHFVLSCIMLVFLSFCVPFLAMSNAYAWADSRAMCCRKPSRKRRCQQRRKLLRPSRKRRCPKSRKLLRGGPKRRGKPRRWSCGGLPFSGSRRFCTGTRQHVR